MHVKKISSLVILAILSLMSFVAHAAELGSPEDLVVLSITGDIQSTNAEGRADFDLEMLKSLPQTKFSTKTIWTEGITEFSGVSLKELLDTVGSKGLNIQAVALNDYAVSIPTSDAVYGGPIVALSMNGKAMSVRDKGPLWIVYPYDNKTAYQTETVYSRSIWQLRKLEIAN